MWPLAVVCRASCTGFSEYDARRRLLRLLGPFERDLGAVVWVAGLLFPSLLM